MTAEDSAVPPPSPPPWWVFHATGRAPDGEPPQLPEPPPWRTFPGGPLQPPPPEDDRAAERRLGRMQDGPQLRREEIDAVNAALLLRRPLLVTGPPGVGKSTLAYLIARELGLGRVLPWNIVSRSTLKDGLYAYDAIGRAQAIAAWRAADAGSGAHAPAAGNAPAAENAPAPAPDTADGGPGGHGPTGEGPPTLGDFVTLGPLGTALLAHGRPRVLLVDELDKSDIDLPNDLLHVLENGSYEIPELVRGNEESATVFTDDPRGSARVRGGRVECAQFPVVVITSNGEREFPAAFRRRCLPLDMLPPGREQLIGIVVSHLRERPEGVEALVDEFEKRLRGGGTQSIDQLLNAVRLTTAGGFQADADGRKLVEMLLRDLSKGR
ncbi:AAA family ATPase [Streptomyces sp. NPDC094466]|uniref:AAA family ATPase n=1 Tax=Streptomyces sp. NPDC094466 TaxID=3366065 RepID=UPI003805A3BE